MTRYEHTQIGHVIIWFLFSIILIASGVAGLSHRETPLVVSIILLAALVLFYNSELQSKVRLCAHHLDPALSVREWSLRRLSDASRFTSAGGTAAAFI